MFLPLHDVNPVRHIPFPYVNYSLIAFTAGVFLLQSIIGTPLNNELQVSLGMIPQVVRDTYPSPSPWFPNDLSLLTYAFLHADIIHLLSNMLFLWVFGDNVEDALGHVKYLIFYLLCAVLAGLSHLALNSDSLLPLIGASGAVAGVMGAYILLYPHARVFVLFKIIIPIPLPIPALWMLGAWFAIQFFYALAANPDGIAWWAHIGGMIAGAVLAYLLRRPNVALFGGR